MSVERMRMALAEAGYPRAHVYERGGEVSVLLGNADDPPERVLWQAFRLIYGDDMSCWSCWSGGYDECGHLEEVAS